MLQMMGAEEVASVIQEQGSVEVQCDFCNQRYVFDEGDAEGFVYSMRRPPGRRRRCIKKRGSQTSFGVVARPCTTRNCLAVVPSRDRVSLSFVNCSGAAIRLLLRPGGTASLVPGRQKSQRAMVRRAAVCGCDFSCSAQGELTLVSCTAGLARLVAAGLRPPPPGKPSNIARAAAILPACPAPAPPTAYVQLAGSARPPRQPFPTTAPSKPQQSQQAKPQPPRRRQSATLQCSFAGAGVRAWNGMEWNGMDNGNGMEWNGGMDGNIHSMTPPPSKCRLEPQRDGRFPQRRRMPESSADLHRPGNAGLDLPGKNPDDPDCPLYRPTTHAANDVRRFDCPPVADRQPFLPERNGDIVPESRHDQEWLADGDRLSRWRVGVVCVSQTPGSQSP